MTSRTSRRCGRCPGGASFLPSLHLSGCLRTSWGNGEGGWWGERGARRSDDTDDGSHTAGQRTPSSPRCALLHLFLFVAPPAPPRAAIGPGTSRWSRSSATPHRPVPRSRWQPPTMKSRGNSSSKTAKDTLFQIKPSLKSEMEECISEDWGTALAVEAPHNIDTKVVPVWYALIFFTDVIMTAHVATSRPCRQHPIEAVHEGVRCSRRRSSGSGWSSGTWRQVASTGMREQAYLYDGYWKDIGTIEAFYNANLGITKWPITDFRFLMLM